MQGLTPDMDELFRKAAEVYPLKNGEDRWEEIAGKLAMQQDQFTRKRKRGRRSLWLLMFFLLATSSAYFFHINQRGRSATINSNHTGSPFPEIVAETKDKSDPKVSPVNTVVRPGQTGDAVSQDRKTTNGSSIFFEMAGTGQSRFIKKQSKGLPLFPVDQDEFPTIQNLASIKNSGTVLQDVDHSLKKLFLRDSPKINTDLLFLDISGMNRGQIKKRSVIHKSYYGLLAGAGFHTVNGRGWTRPGIDLGLLGGYRINEKLSMELSLLYTNNHYKARAKNFDLKSIEPMLSGGRELNEVHGSNKIFDMQLNLQYNLRSRPGRRLFVSAGLSSYKITRESNWYLTSMNGSDEMLYGEYVHSKTYPAAAFNISIGHEKKIGAKTSLRIQPYIQLPVKGIGVGKLKLMRTGIQFGMTRTAH